VTSYVIRGARPMGGAAADIAISGGRFVPVDSLPAHSECETIDAAGLIALPGLVDVHTHLREPGFEQSETILTGSQAAALGGFTAVHAMANTEPVADTPEVTDFVHRAGVEAGFVEVRPVGAVTRGLAGAELTDIAAMARSAARVRVFSDDGKCVAGDSLMREALLQAAKLGVVIAQHAQDPALTQDAQMNDGPLADKLGLVGWPAIAEESIIARDVELAEATGGRLHVCHVSTAGSVEVIRWAKQRGISVTAEVTPHHLLLLEDLVRSYDPLYKVNPPLRRREDTLALRQALADGVIDVVATDHAPHPPEAKECAFQEGAFGMLGLETALPVVIQTLVEPGAMGWTDLARVMSSEPARIGALEGYDQPLAHGQPANVVLVDPDRPALAPRGSLSENNPYDGVALPGRVWWTFFQGTPTVRAGELNPDLLELRKGR
jgi:dihydroorotase